MALFSRLLLCALSLPAIAQAEDSLTRDHFTNCHVEIGQPTSCIPVLACMSTGDVFFGKAIGWMAGSVEGTTEQGLTCQGNWQINNTDQNYGAAGFECSDGRLGTAEFTYLDHATSSVWGSGTLSDGSTLNVWTGPHLFAYLDRSADLISQICPQAIDLLS